MTARKILHLDLDAFFCAVEELQHPELRGRPFAVGGKPEERGVVSSCSYAARHKGVRSAMPMARALRLCPDLQIISSHHSRYSTISRQIMAELRTFSPILEQISIDEAFIDMTTASDELEQIARRMQTVIRDKFDLPCSLGGATNKLVAKIATDFGKSQYKGDGPPNAITIIPPGEEAAFLAPLPVQSLWGVGPKTAQRLAELGIQFIGDLAAHSPGEMHPHFGKIGDELVQRARGLDERPLETEHEAKSISQEITFTRDVAAEIRLRQEISHLSAGVGRRLRQEGLAATTIKLKLRWPDFTTFTRQSTVSQPLDQDEEITAIAQRLFSDNWRPGQAVRLIGVGASGLGPPARQMQLWEQDSIRQKRLQLAVDEINARFGFSVVHRGQSGSTKDESK